MDSDPRSSTGSRRYEPEGLPEGRLVRLDSETARELADLISLKHDFVTARESLDELLTLESSEAESGDEEAAARRRTVVQRALFNAAIISYGRAFASGVRSAKPDVSAAIADSRAEAELLQVHDYMLDLRDKHIAHSVSPLEGITVGAVLAESGEREVRSMVDTRLFFALPRDRDELKLMIRLCRLMSYHMQDRAFESKKRLFFQARSGVDALYELPSMAITTPVEREVAGKSRSPGKRSRSRR